MDNEICNPRRWIQHILCTKHVNERGSRVCCCFVFGEAGFKLLTYILCTKPFSLGFSWGSCLFVCLFVWGFSSHSRTFHSYGNVTNIRWRVAKFDLCSALMAIEQWGFISVPYLQWHGTFVYNGLLRGPVTLTPIMPSVWQWDCPYLFLRLSSVAAGIRTPNLPLARRTL